MLFWLFVIIFVVGIIIFAVGRWMYDNTKYDTKWLETSGFLLARAMGIAIAICLIIIVANHIVADAMVAKNHERYKSLTYQLENNLYDNDNDYGKKELYDQVQEWNEDLAAYKRKQYDFWVGILYPDVFDQFEFISYDTGGNR